MDRRWIRHYDPGFKEEIPYPDKTLYELVRDCALRCPDKPALSFMGTHITYKEMLAAVDHLADVLYANGVTRGTVATLCLPNLPHAVLAFYAVSKLGGIANMVHPLTPPAEMRQYIETTGSDILFILDAFLNKHVDDLRASRIRQTIVASVPDYLSPLLSAGFWLKSGRKIPTVPQDDLFVRWKDLMARSAAPSPTETGDNEPAVYLHSGGTTGSPKSIILSSRNMNVLAIQGPQIIGFDLDTFDPAEIDFSMVSILPMFHGFGLCMGIHTVLANGMKSILIPQFSPDILASVIKKEKPNMIAAVPTLLEGIMKSKHLTKADLSSLVAVFCGGDSLPAELKNRFDAFLKARGATSTVREGYGLTEVVTVCAVNPALDNRPGTVGIPLADMEMKVVKSGTMEEAPIATDGEICVTGPTLMLGYLNDPEATDETVRLHEDGQRWLHTGDFGFMDQDGYFHFKQRIKRILKVSGILVFPSQIEDVIATVPGVREACVIGIPHPYKMQVVKAFVTRDEGAPDEEFMRESICSTCAENLIRYAVPAEIEFRSEMPRTKVGKIDVIELEREEQARREQSEGTEEQN